MLQVPPVELPLITTFPPWQKVVEPPVEIIEAVGFGFTVTIM